MVTDTDEGSTRANILLTLNSTAGHLVMIDPATNPAKDRGKAANCQGSSVAAGLGSIWVGGDQGGLCRLDPADAGVIKRFSLGQGISAIAIEGNSVWVATQGTPAKVFELDAAANRVLSRISAGGGSSGSYYGASRPARMAVQGPDLWITDTSTGSISKIITVSETVGFPILLGNYPTGIVVGEGSVWVTIDAA